MSMKMMILLTSIIPMMINNPMTMGSMLMIQTLMVCMEMTLLSNSPWYSYILFITMIGGLMIMFMYMASISSNYKFKFSVKKMTFTILISMLLMMKFDLTTMNMQKMINNKLNTEMLMNIKSTIKFFNLFKGIITISLLILMFILLIMITNIISKNEGPLKKTYV